MSRRRSSGEEAREGSPLKCYPGSAVVQAAFKSRTWAAPEPDYSAEDYTAPAVLENTDADANAFVVFVSNAS